MYYRHTQGLRGAKTPFHPKTHTFSHKVKTGLAFLEVLFKTKMLSHLAETFCYARSLDAN